MLQSLAPFKITCTNQSTLGLDSIFQMFEPLIDKMIEDKNVISNKQRVELEALKEDFTQLKIDTELKTFDAKSVI